MYDGSDYLNKCGAPPVLNRTGRPSVRLLRRGLQRAFRRHRETLGAVEDHHDAILGTVPELVDAGVADAPEELQQQRRMKQRDVEVDATDLPLIRTAEADDAVLTAVQGGQFLRQLAEHLGRLPRLDLTHGGIQQSPEGLHADARLGASPLTTSLIV